MNIKFSKDGPVTFGALGGTYPQMDAGSGDFSVASGIVRGGVLGPALGEIVRPDNAASITITMGGVKYTADSGELDSPSHLVGPVVNEYHKAVPLTNHLTARFAIRKYVGFDIPRVRIVMENCWAYEPGPKNFIYDFEISIAGKVVYSQSGLTHYHHSRWTMVFNDPGVLAFFPWQGTKAVPNYDPEFLPAESMLQDCDTLMHNSGPMKIGAALGYMPETGAHADIGILPQWAWADVMSNDPRARAITLATSEGMGSFSMHYRDKVTDLPVALKDHPRMTIAGRDTDAGADAFPSPGGDTNTPYTNDIPHHGSPAHLAYLREGDLYFLEEQQFWAGYCAFNSNPNYRGAEQGLVIPEQLRGQAWALRTIAQAVYITPDSHPLKAELNRVLGCNLDWYNATYSNNPDANKLGVLTNGYAIDYAGKTSMAPWMDDHFTSTVGHVLDLGSEKARPLLEWKAKFTVGRMTAPGICWITGAIYSLTVRDTESSPIYDTLAQAYAHDLGATFMALPCAGPAMATAWGKIAMYSPNVLVGDMANIADGYMGYPSNMQPALAYSVDSGIENSQLAYKLFKSRTVKPDYRLGGQFAIIPRDKTTPLPPEGNIMTFEITISGFDSAPQQLPPGSEASLASIRVRIMSPDGATVLAESATLPLVLGSLEAGKYPLEIAALDSKGAVMGTPATGFKDTAEAAPLPQPVTVSLPSAITASVIQES